MWSWNPKPWQHIIDYSAMIGGILFVSKAPEAVRTDWTGLLFAGGMMVTGMVSYVVTDVVMMLDKRLENVKDARMYQQPTEEEKHMGRAFIRDEVAKVVVTGGNVRTAVDMAPQAVRKVPDGFVAMQNTAEVIRLAEVDNAIKKICRRTLTLVEHPDLGFPCGDFREVTWVSTKEMTRNTLLLSLFTLEHHGGIEREADRKNATKIVKDLEVIKRGARAPLPHAIGCWCADCAQK